MGFNPFKWYTKGKKKRLPQSAHLFDKIKNAQYEYEESSWGGISSEAKDLVDCILKANPAERYNC